jgi:hypothetical protein
MGVQVPLLDHLWQRLRPPPLRGNPRRWRRPKCPCLKCLLRDLQGSIRGEITPLGLTARGPQAATSHQAEEDHQVVELLTILEEDDRLPRSLPRVHLLTMAVAVAAAVEAAVAVAVVGLTAPTAPYHRKILITTRRNEYESGKPTKSLCLPSLTSTSSRTGR